MTRRPTMGGSTLVRLLGVAAVAVLLAGCIKFDTQLNVSSDDTVSGEIIFAFDRALLEMAGGSLEELTGGGFEPIPDDVEGVSAEDWEDGNFTGQRFVLDEVPLDEFNTDSADGSLRIERDGDVFRLSANMDMTGGAGDLGEAEDLGFDPSVLMGNAELAIAVTFPGEILETNGQVEGTTVTWEPSLTGANEMTAVARAEPAGEASTLLWVLFAIALLLVLVVGAAMLARRRREPAAVAATGPGRSDEDIPPPPPPPGGSSLPPPPPPPSG